MTGARSTEQGIAGPSDLDLLQAFEPVVRYTQGELFFPAAVSSYIPECDLFVGRSERDRRLLVPYGELTEDRLVSFVAPPGETLSMRLGQEPLGGLELARWNRRPDRPEFHAPSRLARVGIFARLVDTGFTASLLLRGTVPGGTTAAASVKYEKVRLADPRYVYHARVLRSEGWIVLHYMYFYFMNDWRSTFAGANDHESDLEQAFVFLEDAPDGPRPIVVRLRGPRLLGRPAPAAVGRPVPGQGGRTPRDPRRSRLARRVLRGRRVPDGGTDARRAPPARDPRCPPRRSGVTRCDNRTRVISPPRSSAR